MKKSICILLLSYCCFSLWIYARDINIHGAMDARPHKECFPKNGFITKEKLDKLNLSKYDRLMIVAHPDDETLWGGNHLLHGNYFVVCLTNGKNKRRPKEFFRALSFSKDKGMILNYPDKIKKTRCPWPKSKTAITKDLQRLFAYKNWKEIATHNPDGEYGHIQHIKTNRLVTKVAKNNSYPNLMYFGTYYQKNRFFLLSLPRMSDRDLEAKSNMLTESYNSQLTIIFHFQFFWPYENWTKANI